MDYSISGNEIRISLPITTPTGKIRVKRPVAGHASEPVACRSLPVQSGDYLEWQISYDTDSLQEPSVVREVVLNKAQGVRYGYELVRLIVEARKLGILAENEFNELHDLVRRPLNAGIEETERIVRELNASTHILSVEHGFSRHHLRVPNYLKSTEAYGVEIKIAHKQRAVGNQAMIFLNLPVECCFSQSRPPIVGRCAEKSEKLNYVVSAKNAGLISDVVVAFAFASVDHRNDLQMIFERL